MPIYKVQWNYKSSLGGPFMKGDQVELKVDLAEAIEKDSPGVLTPSASLRTWKEGINRSMAGPENAKVVTTYGHGKEELITKDTFKAVKNTGDL